MVNGSIEAFDQRLSQKCPQESWFLSLWDARARSKHGGSTTTGNAPKEL